MRSKVDHIIRLAGLVDPPLDGPAEAALAAAARQALPTPPRRGPGLAPRRLSVSPGRREPGGYLGADGGRAWYGGGGGGSARLSAAAAAARELELAALPAVLLDPAAARPGRARPQSARAALQRRLDAAAAAAASGDFGGGPGAAELRVSAWGEGPGPAMPRLDYPGRARP